MEVLLISATGIYTQVVENREIKRCLNLDKKVHLLQHDSGGFFLTSVCLVSFKLTVKS